MSKELASAKHHAECGVIPNLFSVRESLRMAILVIESLMEENGKLRSRLDKLEGHVGIGPGW